MIINLIESKERFMKVNEYIKNVYDYNSSIIVSYNQETDNIKLLKEGISTTQVMWLDFNIKTPSKTEQFSDISAAIRSEYKCNNIILAFAHKKLFYEFLHTHNTTQCIQLIDSTIDLMLYNEVDIDLSKDIIIAVSLDRTKMFTLKYDKHHYYWSNIFSDTEGLTNDVLFDTLSDALEYLMSFNMNIYKADSIKSLFHAF